MLDHMNGAVAGRGYLRVHSIQSSAPFAVESRDLVEAVDGFTFTSSTALHSYLSGLEEGARVRLMLRSEVGAKQFYYLHKVADVQVAELNLLDAGGGAWDLNANAAGPSGANAQ